MVVPRAVIVQHKNYRHTKVVHDSCRYSCGLWHGSIGLLIENVRKAGPKAEKETERDTAVYSCTQYGVLCMFEEARRAMRA